LFATNTTATSDFRAASAAASISTFGAFAGGVQASSIIAWPLAFADRYARDDAAINRYLALAGSTDGVAQFIAEWDGGVQAAA
jgi:hypothetical protein